jgi:hypothetical protein
MSWSRFEPAELAGVEHQRPDAVIGIEVMHSQDDDVVIAGLVLGLRAALEPRTGPVEQDRPVAGGPPVEVFEPIAVTGRELTAGRSWSAASTLTPNRPAVRSTGHVVEEWATHTDTSGGSSDTDTNELAASPIGCPSIRAAIAVTPDGKAPNTARSWTGSKTWVTVNPAPAHPAVAPAAGCAPPPATWSTPRTHPSRRHRSRAGTGRAWGCWLRVRRAPA